MPQEVTAYKAKDGTLHRSKAQAVAADLALMCDVKPEVAWSILTHRRTIVEALLTLEPDNEP